MRRVAGFNIRIFEYAVAALACRYARAVVELEGRQNADLSSGVVSAMVIDNGEQVRRPATTRHDQVTQQRPDDAERLTPNYNNTGSVVTSGPS